MTTVLEGEVTVADLVAAVRRQQASAPVLTSQPASGQPQRSVSIVAAHPGAGATAVAVAMSDALATRGQQVTLVDGAETPDAFGSVEVEIDSGSVGLRAGKRGHATVLRWGTGVPATVPRYSVLVTDGGIASCQDRVIVCRPTLPSTDKAERLLEEGSLLAVVGASRWPAVVMASLGQSTRRAADRGQVVFFPRHRRVEIHGVHGPTPSNLLAAGSRLIDVVWPDPAAPHSRRWKGARR